MDKKENNEFDDQAENHDSKFYKIEKQISQISGFKKLDP